MTLKDDFWMTFVRVIVAKRCEIGLRLLFIINRK